jgi:hypothetical protein
LLTCFVFHGSEYFTKNFSQALAGLANVVLSKLEISFRNHMKKLRELFYRPVTWSAECWKFVLEPNNNNNNDDNNNNSAVSLPFPSRPVTKNINYVLCFLHLAL